MIWWGPWRWAGAHLGAAVAIVTGGLTAMWALLQ